MIVWSIETITTDMQTQQKSEISDQPVTEAYVYSCCVFAVKEVELIVGWINTAFLVKTGKY